MQGEVSREDAKARRPLPREAQSASVNGWHCIHHRGRICDRVTVPSRLRVLARDTSFLGGAAALLTACSSDPPPPPEATGAAIQVVTTTATPAKAPPAPPPGSCGFFQLRNIVGQPYTPALAEQARLASKAATLRIVDPARPADGSRDADRLTLEVNANNTVVSATCG